MTKQKRTAVFVKISLKVLPRLFHVSTFDQSFIDETEVNDNRTDITSQESSQENSMEYLQSIILNRQLLKDAIKKTTEQNKEILLVFFNDKYKGFVGCKNQVGDVDQLLTIPGEVSLVFHTHPPLDFKNKMLTVYPSASDVEMSIFLSRYPQYRNALFVIGGLVDGKYVTCYWSYDTMNFPLVNKYVNRILINGENTEENRENLGKAVGLHCLNLDSLSLSEIADQLQQNFYKKIDGMIRDHDYVVLKNNTETREAIEKMYPMIEKFYDYEDGRGLVYTYYLLLAVSGDKVQYAKAKVYKDNIEITTMSDTPEGNVIRIGNKYYNLPQLKNLCKGFCVSL